MADSSTPNSNLAGSTAADATPTPVAAQPAPTTAPATAAPNATPTPATLPPADNKSLLQVPGAVTPPAKKPGIAGRAIGSILGALYGPRTQTRVNPDGSTSQVPAPPPSKGMIFRHILAGMLIGGAAAQQEHNRNPYSGVGAGVVTGAGAEMQDERNQAQLQRNQAVQDFERQQAVKNQNAEMQMKREELDMKKQESATQQQYTKALAAEATHRIIASDLAMAGQSFKDAQEHAALGAGMLADMAKANVKPVDYVNGTLQEAEAAIKANPHYVGMVAVPIKVIPTPPQQTKDGTVPEHIFRYAIVDLNAPVTGDSGLKQLMQKAGLYDKYHDYFTPGRTFTADQYLALTGEAYDKIGNDYKINMQDADLRAKNAQSDLFKQESLKDYQEMLTAEVERSRASFELGQEKASTPEAALKAFDALKAIPDKDKNGKELTPEDKLNQLKPNQRLAIFSTENAVAGNLEKELANLPMQKDETGKETYTPAAESEYEKLYPRWEAAQGMVNAFTAFGMAPKKTAETEQKPLYTPVANPTTNSLADKITTNPAIRNPETGNIDPAKVSEFIDGLNVPADLNDTLKKMFNVPTSSEASTIKYAGVKAVMNGVLP